MSEPTNGHSIIKKRMTGMSEQPLVSVIMPTYTEERAEIERAIESVAEQSYANIELIVVDSADHQWLAAYCIEVDRCEYVAQEPRGVSAARNLGLDLADGDVVAFLDADDYYAERKLDRQVVRIADGADVVYSDSYHVSNTGSDPEYRPSFEPAQSEPFYIDFFRHDGQKGNIPTSTIAVRASRIGDRRFNERLDGGEDYHFWVRLFESSDRIDHIDDPLAYIRQRQGSLSSDPDMMCENRLQAIELLCDQYDELGPYRKERELLERYDYARHLLFAGRIAEARSIFFELFAESGYYRAGVLLIISTLPFGHSWVVEKLDALYAEVR